MRKPFYIPYSENCFKEPVRFFKAMSNADIGSELFNYCSAFLNNSDYKELSHVESWEYDDWNDIFLIKRNQGSKLPNSRPLKIKGLISDITNYQIDLSIHHLNNKIRGRAKDKSKKEFLKNIVEILSVSGETIRSNECNQKFQKEILFPFAIVSKHIYTQFSKLIKGKDDFLNELFTMYDETNLLYEPRGLSLNIIKEIINIKYKSKNIFEIKNYDKENLLKHFMHGEFNKITTPIIFLSKAEPTYYLIFKLCQYLGFEETDIASKKIFKIKIKEYSAKSAYTAKNRIGKRKNVIKDIIDDIINANLS